MIQDGPGVKSFDLNSSIKRFYWLSKFVPGVGIKQPDFKDYRVFVQSMSQGSRCLKAKTLLLYKVNCCADDNAIRIMLCNN